MIMSFVFDSYVGNFGNGSWLPSRCGTKPSVPAIGQSSVDEYNRSVKVHNEWQVLAQKYYSCLVEEANADNTLIADTANHEQAKKFRAEIERIYDELTKAKMRLDGT